MKNTRICPKCGGTDIVRYGGYVGAYGAGNYIATGATVFSAVGVNRYICCTCGFVEEWIDTEHLKKVSESKKLRRDI